MRILLLAATILTAFCGVAQASGTLVELQTPNLYVTKISGNGEYAVGSVLPDAFGARWTSNGNVEEVLPELNIGNGINDAGTIAGSIPENGGSDNGGRDLGAFSAVGSAPVQLTNTLQTNSSGYAIADDGTVVGLSFGDGSTGAAVAFIWTAAAGMSALPVTHPQNYSRANVISADGRVIAGWNDDDTGSRNAVIWHDLMPLDVTDASGNPVGEADGISSNGQFVVGGGYTDVNANTGSWRWDANAGLTLIPDMDFAFGVSDDGKTVVGSAGFFADVPRAAMIWHEGVGTVTLAAYLADQGIAIPADLDPNLAGGFGAMSADGLTMGGFTSDTNGDMRSFIIRLDRPDLIFQDGFDGAPTH
ncbi:MAG: hypothetical protein ABI082_04670 [Dokdonella sp.]